MRQTGTYTWPAPVRGWITSGNITQAPPDAAERLDNFFPTAQGAKLRAGCSKHATLSVKAARFMTHIEGDAGSLFAGTVSDIYEISSPADADTTPTAILTGLTSGDWSSVQFTNAGDSFMVGVNGADHAVYFDGTDMQPLVDETVYDLDYDALTGAFTVGQAVTGGTSGASAEILAVAPSSATAGTLKVGAITGTFQDNEALTDPVTGAATSNIPSGTSTASSITISGVATDLLSQVWIYKERQFYVEKGTLSAWYNTATDSVGGTLSEINLQSVFRDGGSLLFGANWSVDSGDGLDDKCVFVTDQGEIAVFSGTNPNSSSTWALEGVYKVGPPIDKHAHVSMGGDLLIVSDDGIFPLSQALVKDYAALVAGAFTAPIEDEWQANISQRSSVDPVAVSLWHSRGMMLVSVPGTFESLPVAYVANSRLGAWSRYLGWDVNSSVVFEDQLYFCDPDGLIFKAEVGGTDNGTAYSGYFVPKFSDMGVPNQKVANHVGLLGRASVSLKFNCKVLRDYERATIQAPSALAEPPNSATWGTGVWGTSIWGGTYNLTGQQKWKSAGGSGFALAPGIAITSNSTATPEVELTAVQMRYEVGSIL